MTFLQSLATVSLLLLALQSACGADGSGNIVLNGSFEILKPGWTGISNWDGRTSFAVSEPAADGTNYVIAHNLIYQDIPTIPGKGYALQFAFGGHQSVSFTQPLRVHWGGQVIATVPFTRVAGTQPTWNYLQYEVVATSSLTRLGFDTLSGSGHPLVDDVSVYAVDEFPICLARKKLVSWGGPGSGGAPYTPVPETLQSVVAVAAGYTFSLGLKRDGTVVAWGNYSTWPTNVPAGVPPGLSNVTAIAAGSYHSLALRSDGTVVAWGYNSSGQTNVPADLRDVVAISAGTSHSLALKRDGTVVGWGASHATAPPGLSNVIAIAAGTGSMALKGDGTIALWGAWWSGKSIPSDLTNVVAIAGGYFSWLAVRADGRVYDSYGGERPGLTNAIAVSGSWGNDGHVNLALKADHTVVGWGFDAFTGPVPAGLSNVVAIAAGGCHNLALLGCGRPFLAERPLSRTVVMRTGTCFRVQATGTLPLHYQWQHNGVDITGANGHRLFLTNLQPQQAGEYRVVVSNAYGQVASESATLNLVPLQIDRQPKSVSQHVGGTATFNVAVRGAEPWHYQWRHNGTELPGATSHELTLDNLAFTHAGTYSVVITNAYGQLLSADAELTVFPVLITANPTNKVSYRGGNASFWVRAQGIEPLHYQWLHNGSPIPGANTAALSLEHLRQEQQGRYSVIVSNKAGQVESTSAALELPSVVAWGNLSQHSVPGHLTNVLAIASSSQHNMALLADRTIAAWWEDVSLFAQATNVPLDATNILAIACGGYEDSSFALRGDGAVRVWGANAPQLPALSNVVSGSVGYYFVGLFSDGTVFARRGRVEDQLPPGLSNVVSVSVGYGHALALKSDGSVVAWGLNDKGQTNAPADLTNAVAISADYNNSMALRADGTVVVWGDNRYGQTNVPPGLTNVVRIAAGDYHCLALKADGTVAAWGGNWAGQTNIPAGLTNVVAIAAGGSHCLALLGDGPPRLRTVASEVAVDALGFRFSVPTESGRLYQLEYKDSLEQPGWQALPLVPGTGEPVILRDPAPGSAQRFYRVRDW